MRSRLIVSFLMVLVVLSMATMTFAHSSGSVVIYSPESEDIINLLVPWFERETGVRVELITAGTGELTRRVQTEQHNPYADVFFGGSLATLKPIVDLLDEYVSPHNEHMMDSAKNTDRILSDWTADGSVILVNTNLLNQLGIEINGYADLLQPELKGKIIAGDPAASSSAFFHLTNMVLAMGDGQDYFHPDGWAYVKKLLDQLEGKVANSSGIVHRGVADGEYVAGLTWEDPAASWVRDGAPVKIVYQEEGVVFMNAPLAKIKGGKNPENAKKFIDFVLSAEVQSALGTELTARPLRQNVSLGDHMFPMEQMNLLFESAEASMDNREAVIRKYQEVLMNR